MIRWLSYSVRRSFSQVDRLTDSLTSYRLVYYVLLMFVAWASLAALLGIGNITFKWYDIALSAAWLIIVCRTANLFFSRLLNVATNHGSDLITALILALIFAPAAKPVDYIVLAGAGILAIASKYILVLKRSHIFNPAALGAFLMGFVFHKYAVWWVGTSILTPLVFIGGWLIICKMKRYILVSVFIGTYLIIAAVVSWNGTIGNSWHQIWLNIADTQLLFFAYIMLTEPMTSPPTLYGYLPYSILVAILYGSVYWHLGSWEPIFSPEGALLVGNILAANIAFSPRYQLKLLEKRSEAAGIKSYVFSKPKDFKFTAGQYMEWTLPVAKSDSRGNRRYLTIASAPSEEHLMISMRTPEKMSSFKSQLDNSKANSKMLASRIAGSFTLPKNQQQKIVFLAGGIGVTPYRSITKWLIDNQQNRDIVLLYSVNDKSEIAFNDVFKQAEPYGVKAYYLDQRIDDKAIKKIIPDFQQRKFFISGPWPFVNAMEQILNTLGVPSRNVKTDYFPGYA